MPNTTLLCPKCGSDQLSANKKGFSGRKAVAGLIVTGIPGGAFAGTIGSNKIKITCLSCGNQFIPGQGATSQIDYQRKKDEKAKSKFRDNVGAFILLIIIIAVSLLVKTCSKDSSDTNDTKSEVFSLENASPEFKRFQQEVSAYEMELNKINDEAQAKLIAFDEKWMGNEVKTTKNFISDVERIKSVCIDTKVKVEKLTVPKVPKELGSEQMNMEILFQYPNKKIADGYMKLNSFYNDYKLSFTSRDPTFWIELGKVDKEKGQELIQNGFKELKDAKQTLRVN
ncbi:MAG: hypothetical protein M3004_11075 [Bacteroidota bacterium]|nr:hypothetical protein [Bacteroidota bacterium]